MKKTLMALAAMAAMAVTAADTGTESYLYWMIDTQEVSSKTFDYNNVRVRAYETASGDNTSYLTLYYSNDQSAGESVSHEDVQNAAEYGLSFYAALGSMAGSQYSYVVELFNDTTKVGYSESIVFTDAMSRDYIATITPSGGFPAGAVWVAGGFTAVPEPNSAVLLLIGCAALGLRRKKMNAEG